MMRLGAPATLIEYNSMSFVITYMPDRICMRQYIKDLQQYNTRKLLNVTKFSYPTELFNVMGIGVEELFFPNGTFPDSEIIEQWLGLVRNHFQNFPKTAIAVHDYSGLGRAAVLVAIALMENGMKSNEAIEIIRSKRRGAFNSNQLEELARYKPKHRLLERERSKLFFITRRFSSSDSGQPSTSKQ